MLTNLGTYGAVCTKVRALWGKRLTQDDYKRMLAMRSVPEIAAFLRTKPGWAGALDSINVLYVHRAELEMALRRHNVEDYLRLFPFLPTKDYRLLRYPVLSMELEQIMRFMTLASTGRAHEYDFNMPHFFDRYSKIKYSALSAAVTYDDMLEAVKETDFHKALLRLKPGDGGFPEYRRVESAMYSYFFHSLEDIITRDIRGKLQKELLMDVRMQADLKNIEIIMRVKRYFPKYEEDLLSFLIPTGGNMRQDQLKTLYTAQDEEAAMKALSGTFYGRYFSKYEFDNIEQYYYAILYEFNKRRIALEPPSVLIPVCYLFLQQVELSNLIHVIECVRYGVPEEAEKLLVGLV